MHKRHKQKTTLITTNLGFEKWNSFFKNDKIPQRDDDIKWATAYIKRSSYKERLEKLNLPTLKYRREKNDMVEMYKHFNVYDQTNMPTKFVRKELPRRKHDFQLVMKRPKDGKRGPQTNSLYYRAIKVWNELSKSVVRAEGRWLDRVREQGDIGRHAGDRVPAGRDGALLRLSSHGDQSDLPVRAAGIGRGQSGHRAHRG